MKNLFLFLTLLMIWIALNGKMDLKIFIFGVVFSIISTVFTRVLFMDSDRINHRIPIWFLVMYFFAMIYFIFKSSLQVIINIFKGNITPSVVRIESKLKNDWYISIVANSITLTPGTVTIDKNGNRLQVLWYYSKGNEDAYKEIAWQFEKLFFMIDKV